jgi:hypothetical protein
MGGSSRTPSQTTQTTQTQLPIWLENASQDLVHRAEDVAARPYEAYQGQQIADFTSDQRKAFWGVRGMTGKTGDALTGLSNQAQGIANYDPQQVQGGTLPGVNLQQYMNPYLDTVARNAMTGLEQQRQTAQNSLADQAQAGNAYGGSRFALQGASLDAQAAQNAGNLQAQLYGQGFQNAQAMAQQDLSRGLQAQGMNQQAGLAAQNLGLQGLTLAGQLRQGAQAADYQDYAAREAIGQQRQGLEQQHLDLAQQQWQDARNYPLQQLQIMQSVLGGTPYGGSTVSTGVGPQGSRPSPAMGALGGAASGAAAGSALGPWGALAGAAIGGVGGYMGSR